MSAYTIVGICPTIDVHSGGVRESPEDQTIKLAGAATTAS